jgi:hypothetical protein
VLAESGLPESASFFVSSPGLERTLRWSPDWRLLFSAVSLQPELSPRARFSIWAIPVEPHTAQPAGKPERVTPWGDFLSCELTVRADGKRVSYLKEYWWEDLYLAELGPGGASIKPLRRFTFDRRGSSPQGWTRDSQAIFFRSNRNGRFEIFRQGLRDGVAEAIVQGPDDYDDPLLSPDGSLLLYAERARTGPGAPASPYRLMRRPVAGGSPEPILEHPAIGGWGFGCPPNPRAGCVLTLDEGKDMVSTGLILHGAKGSGLGPSKAGTFSVSRPTVKG